MTTEPRVPLQQIPTVSADEVQPSAGHSSTAAVVQPAQKAAPISRSALWLRRSAVLLFVVLCAGMGVMLVVLPWSLQWTDNHLLWGHPEVREILANGFIRGLCSGLGILDIWIGFREAAHYHEEPHASK